MNLLTKKIWISVFVVALILPSVSTYLPLEKVEIENERLVFPEVTARSISDPSFYREVLAYTRDASPVRARLIQASSNIDFSLFGDSPAPNQVLVGRDGWLFGRESIEDICAPIPPATAVSNLIDTAEFLSERGINVVVIIAPTKFAIHPEKLTETQQKLATCGFRNDRVIRQMTSESTAAQLVDTWSLFEDLKKTGLDPYFKSDTHFTYEASIPWMQEILSHIDPTVWEPEAVRSEGNIRFMGNLMTLIGLGRAEIVERATIDRGLPVEPDRQLHDRFSEHQTATEIYTHEGTATPMIEGQTVMLKDSFMDIPAPSIAQYFAHLTMMDWRSAESVRYFAQTAVTADLVIIETSEENFLDRFGKRSLLDQLSSAADH